MGLEAGGFAAALVTFGVRLAEAYAITSLMTKNLDQPIPDTTSNQGGSVQLPPATNNKLPVVYGTQYVSPIIVDALLSTDQQTIWYVLAFSETTDAGTIKFGDVLWDDKLLVFDPATPSEISCWYVPASAGGAEANSRVTGLAGKIGMWFYSNGSFQETTHRCIDTFGTGAITDNKSNVDAVTVLNDSGIPEEIKWTAEHLMSNTVFAICRVNYDQNHGVTNIGQIKAEIQNSLKQPGSVIKDYLKNSRYGCGIDEANINLDSLTQLDTFAATEHSLTLVDGGEVSGPRYTLNGLLSTGQDCMVNLNILADSADSWIQWDERGAQWGVVMNVAYDDLDPNKQEDTLFTINKDNIIGGIDILPTDLKSSANSLTIQYPNFTLQNQTDYRYYELPAEDMNPNEPINNLSVNFSFVDNDLQATWLGYKKLWATRSDLIINFSMDYSGIKIDAGDIIRIDHDWYGWGPSAGKPYKLFRVTQIKEAKDPSGFLSVQISAMEYNSSIYTTTNPGFFTLTEFNFNLLTDPNYITEPGKPTITVTTSTGVMTVSSHLPGTGRVQSMEFWYGTTSTIAANNFTLYETQNYVTTSSGSVSNTKLYPNTGTETINVTAFPTGTYWWTTKAIGPFSSSPFSPVSESVIYTRINSSIIDGASILDNSISGSKVISGDPATTGQANQQKPSFFDNLGPLAAISLGLFGANYAYKQGWFDGEKAPAIMWDALGNPVENVAMGGGEGGGTQVAETTMASTYYDDQGNYYDQPQEGLYQEIQVASNEVYDTPDSYSNFDDVPDAGGDYWA